MEHESSSSIIVIFMLRPGTACEGSWATLPDRRCGHQVIQTHFRMVLRGYSPYRTLGGLQHH